MTMRTTNRKIRLSTKRHFRYARTAVVFLLALSILFSSCQNADDPTESRNDKTDTMKRYEKTELGTTGTDEASGTNDAVEAISTIYYSKIGMLGENRIFRLQMKDGALFMCLTDSEGNVIKEEICPHNYYSFDTDNEGRIYIYSETINEERKCTEMKVYVYDPDFSLVDEIDLGYGTLTNGTFNLKNLDIDPNRRIILSEPYSYIKIFDLKGKLINTIEYFVIDLDVGEKGKLLTLGLRDQVQHVVSFIDPATGIMDREYKLDGSGYSAVVYDKSDKSIYIADGSGIFRYSPDDNTKEYIFDNIRSSGIGGFTVDDFVFGPEGVLFVAAGPKLYRFSVVEGKGAEAETEVCELTFGKFYAQNETWESAAKEFELINPNVRIKLIDYRKEYADNLEKYITTLNTELMSGRGPDMLYSGELPFNRFGEKGFLADLSDYMKNDPDFSDAAFYMDIIESFRHNGRLYAMPLTFKSQAVIASGTNLRAEGISIDDTKWDWTDFYDICKRVTKDENGDGIYEKYAMPVVNEYYLLSAMCGGDYSTFADIKGKKARFDSEEFRDVLELWKAFYRDQLVHPSKSDYEMESSDRDMFTFTPVYLSPDHFLIIQLVKFSEDSVLLRMPGEYGQGKVSAGAAISINSSCKSRDVCWEFIKYLLNYKQLGQLKNMSETTGFFTNKAINDARLDSLGPISVSGFGDGLALDRKYRDFIANYISDTRSSTYPGKEISNIVSSEAGAFFNGAASADAVAKRIQNRVELYLNE
jgi:multiple sugar transport system substrate-binding protein